ncbi:MAG: hypothetical protein M3417_01025 [Actinomycetota bacterium]|nr:hypothetical protein [Actinomycetota bacterium]
MKRFVVALGAVAGVLAAPTAAPAATPDGLGPYADTVVQVQQGLRKDGTPVLPQRSDPAAALGVAENTSDPANETTNPVSFFSLGFGGHITLGFDNNICNAPGPDFVVELTEATSEPYGRELVDVFVSADGVTYVLAASAVDKDELIALPDSVPVARFVRLVDVTNPDEHPANADGYDVDGVKALHTNCVAQGRMTGGGSLFAAGERTTHGFTLHCDPTDGPNNLQVNWAGSRFHLTELTAALCSNNGTDPRPPRAAFDTYQGAGVGRLNGVDGATIEWTFTDSGEPGTADTGRILIRDVGGTVVHDVPVTSLDRGNHQAHAR